MIDTIKKAMRRLTPKEVAARELADAELEILQWHSTQEHAAYNVELLETRIRRLRDYLARSDAQ